MKQHLLSCLNCGNDFTARRKDSQYCSKACRQHSYRLRQQERYQHHSYVTNPITNTPTAADIEKQKEAAIQESIIAAQKKENEEIIETYANMTKQLEAFRKDTALQYVKRELAKILDKLFKYDSGEISYEDVRYLYSQINYLVSSSDFKLIESEFEPASLIKEKLLPHIETIKITFYKNEDENIDLIPLEIKSQLKKIYEELL